MGLAILRRRNAAVPGLTGVRDLAAVASTCHDADADAVFIEIDAQMRCRWPRIREGKDFFGGKEFDAVAPTE